MPSLDEMPWRPRARYTFPDAVRTLHVALTVTLNGQGASKAIADVVDMSPQNVRLWVMSRRDLRPHRRVLKELMGLIVRLESEIPEKFGQSSPLTEAFQHLLKEAHDFLEAEYRDRGNS